MKTCPDCGERVYSLGCVNCNEEAYIEEQVSRLRESEDDEDAPSREGQDVFERGMCQRFGVDPL